MSEEIKGSVRRTIDSLCVWHRSQSIESNNPMYKSCVMECDGLNRACKVYMPKKTYEEYRRKAVEDKK